MLYVFQYCIIVETLVMPFSAEVHRTEARELPANDFAYLRWSRGTTEISSLRSPHVFWHPYPSEFSIFASTAALIACMTPELNSLSNRLSFDCHSNAVFGLHTRHATRTTRHAPFNTRTSGCEIANLRPAPFTRHAIRNKRHAWWC